MMMIPRPRLLPLSTLGIRASRSREQNAYLFQASFETGFGTTAADWWVFRFRSLSLFVTLPTGLYRWRSRAGTARESKITTSTGPSKG